MEEIRNMRIINIVILKIRDFIIGLRFKKYGHFKTRLDNFVIKFAYRFLIRQSLSAILAGLGAVNIAMISATPAKTKIEQQKKALAIANSIINTTQGIMKVYANF
jgi:hypothetical protein